MDCVVVQPLQAPQKNISTIDKGLCGSCCMKLPAVSFRQLEKAKQKRTKTAINGQQQMIIGVAQQEGDREQKRLQHINDGNRLVVAKADGNYLVMQMIAIG